MASDGTTAETTTDWTGMLSHSRPEPRTWDYLVGASDGRLAGKTQGVTNCANCARSIRSPEPRDRTDLEWEWVHVSDRRPYCGTNAALIAEPDGEARTANREISAALNTETTETENPDDRDR